jgi:hypothetical protein
MGLGDRAGAALWAGVVLTLWSDADAFTAPLLRRMRRWGDGARFADQPQQPLGAWLRQALQEFPVSRSHPAICRLSKACSIVLH